ncbi:MAG: DUF2079 domain-containing protein [Candidatus Levybacteria bacterium]|nr:DUF2079 domain-containing protein [Candidatus Levybacteria bacterium]
MKSRLYSILKFVIGWPLSVIAFVFIAKILIDQAPTLQPNLTSIQPLLFATGIICFLIFYFLRSYIWYRIVRGFHPGISFKDSSYMWSVSELKRYIPGNVWSFLGRTVLFAKRGVAKKDIGHGLIIEAEVFVWGCLVVSLLSLPFLLANYSVFLGQLAGGLLALLIALYIFSNHVSKTLPSKLRSVTAFLFPPFAASESLFLIFISTIALFFFGLGNYLVMSSAFGTDPQLMWQLIGVFVLAFVAGYLSIVTPAGFGVREGVVIYALSKITSSGLAAFAALFTRIVLILAELIFILLSYIWYKTENKYVHNVEKVINKYPYEAIVLSMSALYAIYITAASFLRYDNYYTGRFDLGNMVQTVWNTLHGNFFMLTNPDGIEQISRLAFHADFILILLTPFYLLWQDPKMLLLIQTIVVSCGALFVYLIAKEVLKNNYIGVVLAFAYLINPSLQRANLYDFHAVVLATTFLLATFYFYLKRKYLHFIIFAILAALCKEQIWLIVALFGPLIALHHRKWIWGAGIFAVSTGMFFFLLEYAIPSSLGANHFALEYYSGFGSSPTDIIKAIILSPDKVMAIVMEPERMRFLTQIFSPLGYLSYVFPFTLIFAGPDLLISLLSSNSNLYQIYYQYTATMTPFIFISAIYGMWIIIKVSNYLSFLRRQESRFRIKSGMTISVVLILYILYNALHTAYAFGPMPGSKEPNIAMFTKPFGDREYIDTFIATIPEEYSVAASNNLGSHLSQREVIYVLPYGIDRADMVLVSAKDNYAKETIVIMEKNSQYRKVADKDGFVVFQKK